MGRERLDLGSLHPVHAEALRVFVERGARELGRPALFDLWHVEAGPLLLHEEFVAFLCRRSHYDALAAHILGSLAVREEGADATVVHDVALRTSGRSAVAPASTRLDDLRLLFEAESGHRPLDSAVRRLFGYELLIAGETLNVADYHLFLASRWGAIAKALPRRALLRDFDALAAAPGVQALGDRLRADRLSSGVEFHIDRLAAVLDARSLSVFVGAGFSKAPPASAVTWYTFRDALLVGLLDRLAAEGMLPAARAHEIAQELAAGTMKPEVLMDLIHGVVGSRLFECLAVLDQGTWNHNHACLAEWARRGAVAEILTTNFDTYIEGACAATGAELRRSADDMECRAAASMTGQRNSRVPLTKLHGTLDRHDTIVMTLKGAGAPLSEPKRAVLAKAVATSPLLFLGYSGFDNDIYPALRGLAAEARAITWCFRAYARAAHVEELLTACGDRAVGFECNLDRLCDELAARTIGTLAPREDYGSRQTPFDPESALKGWARQLACGEALEIVAGMLAHIGQHAEASRLLARLVRCGVRQRDANLRLRATVQLVRSELRRGASPRVKARCRRCMELARELAPGTHLERRATLLLGDAHAALDESQAAEGLYEEVLQAGAADGHSDLVADASLRLADLLQQRGDWRRALSHYRAAWRRYRTLGDVLAVAACRRRIGGIHFERGRTRSAIGHVKASLRLAEETADPRSMAMGYQNVALVHASERQYALADGLYSKARSLWFDLRDLDSYGECSEHLASMYLDANEPEKAVGVLSELHLNFNAAPFIVPHAEPAALARYRSQTDIYLARYFFCRDQMMGVEPHVSLSSQESSKFEHERAELEANVLIERSRRIVQGREPVRDIEALASAHYWLANYEGDPAYAHAHAREHYRLRLKAGTAGSDADRRELRQWVSSLERRKLRP